MDKHIEEERIQLFNRLMLKKEKILEATCEIEDLRRKYLNQNQTDEDASIESGIYKNIYNIIECLSEIIGYTQGKGVGIYRVLIDFAIHARSLEGSRFSQKGELPQEEYIHIAVSRMLDAMCVAVNSVTITWNFKKEPFVNIGNLESIVQLFRGPG